MRKIIAGILAAFLFIGCSAKVADENVTPKLVVGNSLSEMKINDQFGNAESIQANTKKVIFAFSKATAHTCNDYFKTKDVDYLSKNNSQFVADVSAAPSLIRKMFIMPGLKDFKHTVLILEDKEVAAGYRANMDTEKIVVVQINNHKIVNISTVTTVSELTKEIEVQ